MTVQIDDPLVLQIALLLEKASHEDKAALLEYLREGGSPSADRKARQEAEAERLRQEREEEEKRKKRIEASKEFRKLKGILKDSKWEPSEEDQMYIQE